MRELLIIIATIALMFFSSCEGLPKDYQNAETIYDIENKSDLKIYTIDSCEYIGKLLGYNSDVLTHKGNCKFCLIRNKK